MRPFAHGRARLARILFIAAVPLVFSVGAGAEYWRASETKASAQQAIDRAALAAGRMAAFSPAGPIEEAARRSYETNIGGDAGEAPLSVEMEGERVTVRTKLSVPSYFLRVLGVRGFDFDLVGRSSTRELTYEVALVLDTSASMSGSRMVALRQAAASLVDDVFRTAAAGGPPGSARVAVVPFAASVNIGPANAAAPWVDGDARSPRHFENFEIGADAGNASRLKLFESLGVAWGGCVEARAHPLDVDDTPASPADPATLFVPMFAPDEPDANGFDNDYLPDVSAACTGDDRLPTTGGRAADAQARLCKYREAPPLAARLAGGLVLGPNLNCTSAPVRPLTGDRAAVEAAIAGLQARGMTNLAEGIAWGWRTLSPDAPFTEGRPYGDADNRKILVVMTDGENAYDTYDNINRSMYGAFGYVAKGHLGTTSASRDTVVAQMNERTLQACGNAKAAGVRIYTVAFGVADAATEALLAECASTPETAFRVEQKTQLAGAFRSIASDIAALRVVE